MSALVTTTCDKCGATQPARIEGWYITGGWVSVNVPGWPLNTVKLTNIDFCSLKCASEYLLEAERHLIETGKPR